MSLTPLFDAGTIIVIHTFMAVGAFVLGCWQLLGTKRTLSHRTFGYLWAALMLSVAGTSFWIHDLQLIGPFRPIHIVSIIVLINVPIAIHAARSDAVKSHRAYMRSLFYLALVTAGALTLQPGRVMHDVLFAAQ